MAICLSHLVLLERSHVSFQLFYERGCGESLDIPRQGPPALTPAGDKRALDSWRIWLAGECKKNPKRAKHVLLSYSMEDLHSVGSNCEANRPIPLNTRVTEEWKHFGAETVSITKRREAKMALDPLSSSSLLIPSHC